MYNLRVRCAATTNYVAIRPHAIGGITMQQITTTVGHGIPTAIAIDHYGYVVPELDQAVAFLTDVLGFELLTLDDPIAFGDASFARWYHVHPRASARFAFLRYGPAIIEFTEC